MFSKREREKSLYIGKYVGSRFVDIPLRFNPFQEFAVPDSFLWGYLNK